MPLTFSPRANTASPAALMLVAALWSRSWFAPHSGQFHFLTVNGSDDNVCPQPEQRLSWEPLSMATSERPPHSALYANWRTNSPHPSAIALLSVGCGSCFSLSGFDTDHLVLVNQSADNLYHRCPVGNRRFWREVSPPSAGPWHGWPSRAFSCSVVVVPWPAWRRISQYGGDCRPVHPGR